jgi:hypothetical protein
MVPRAISNRTLPQSGDTRSACGSAGTAREAPDLRSRRCCDEVRMLNLFITSHPGRVPTLSVPRDECRHQLPEFVPPRRTDVPES